MSLIACVSYAACENMDVSRALFCFNCCYLVSSAWSMAAQSVIFCLQSPQSQPCSRAQVIWGAVCGLQISTPPSDTKTRFTLWMCHPQFWWCICNKNKFLLFIWLLSEWCILQEYDSASAALDAYIADFDRNNLNGSASTGRLVLQHDLPSMPSRHRVNTLRNRDGRSPWRLSLKSNTETLTDLLRSKLFSVCCIPVQNVWIYCRCMFWCIHSGFFILFFLHLWVTHLGCLLLQSYN